MSQSVKMVSNVVDLEMEKYLSILSRETQHALCAMQMQIPQWGPKLNEFKIDFLKSANYQLMLAFKRFEMQLRTVDKPTNIAQQSDTLDFLKMPPPSMPMNTPFAMFGERTGRMSQTNATPFMLSRDSNNLNMEMDLDCETVYSNGNSNKVNGFGRDVAGPNATDRIVYRTKGVNAMNGYSGATNNTKNDFTGTNVIAENTANIHYAASSNHTTIINDLENQLNAAKRNLFMSSTNDANSHGDAGTSNGPRDTQSNHQATGNDYNGVKSTSIGYSDVSNGRENTLSANNIGIFKSTDTNGQSGVINGLFAKTNTSVTRAPNEHSGNSNSHAATSRESVFTRLYFNSSDTRRNNGMRVDARQALATGSSNQKCDDNFQNGHTMNTDDDNDGNNDDAHFDCDEQNALICGQRDDDNLASKVNANHRTSATNLFESAPYALNDPSATTNGGEYASNRKFADLNPQPNGQANSVALHRKVDPSKKSRREWMCFYCKKDKVQTIQAIVFKTVDEVYDHWKFHHSNDGGATDAIKQQRPFRFYSVDLLTCQMDSCYYYSTFQGLKRHHKKNHANDLFVPVLNGRCALCLYTGDGLYEHSCSSLQNGIQTNLYNPVLLTDNELAGMQTIESQEMKKNRPKVIECQHCRSIFDSRQEMTQHHHENHGHITIKYEIIDADTKPVVSLICNCCQREIQPKKYVDHLKFMAKSHWKENSIALTWDGWYRRFEMTFLKSEVIFSNGLVLFKQNIICTDLGNHAGFTNLAKQIFASLKSG